MSIAVSKKVWGNSRARGAARLVLLCLAEHADHEGVAWPSVHTIHLKTLVSERHIIRCINWLVAAGELEILREGHGRGRRPVYRVSLGVADDSPARTADTGETDNSSTDVDTLSEKLTSGSSKGDRMSPKPIVEPTTKPSGKRQPRMSPGRRPSNPPSKRRKRKTTRLVMPAALGSRAFKQAWKAFVQHRREIRKPLTKTAGELALKRLAAVGEEEAIARIERSITNGWQGLFFPGDSAYYRYLHDDEIGGAPPSREDDTTSRLKAMLHRREHE